MPRQPHEQWWTIRGDDIMAALERVKAGDDPAIVYLELEANSDSTDYGSPDASNG